jgi:hypothetical protein
VTNETGVEVKAVMSLIHRRRESPTRGSMDDVFISYARVERASECVREKGFGKDDDIQNDTYS